MSQQQGNDMAAPEPLANTEPDKSAQGAIEDKLRNLYTIVRAGKDPDTGRWHITEEQFVNDLQAIITTETTRARASERRKVADEIRKMSEDPKLQELFNKLGGSHD